MAEQLQKAGVELVVENLSKFLSNLTKANKGLASFEGAATAVKKRLETARPQAGLLEKAFVSLGKTIKNFAENILQRILVIALGVLVRDAIRKVIDVIGEMIGAVVDAANEFQALEVRLNSFNMNALIESGMSFNEAMERSIALTKEQLGWTIKLAIQSPYDATDISSAYSLARSYGFVDAKAKQLTDAITNFASGMGLGNVAVERITTNLGQMVQQGKITGTELRDLARGSFVPVNKILGMIADNLGITIEELNKMRKAGTTDPQWFVEGFIQLAETDFAGAAEKMSRTLPKALGNLKDMFVGMPALYSIKPMFDAIGGGVADLVDTFKGAKLEALISTFERIGKALASIVRGIFNLLPSTESLSDSILGVFQNIATWLEQNRGAIVEWVKNAITFLGQLAYTIKTEVIPAISKFFAWISENKETIKTIGLIWLAFQVGNIALRAFLGALIGVLGFVLKVTAAFIGWNTSVFIWKVTLKQLGVSLGGLSGVFGKLVGWIGVVVASFMHWKWMLDNIIYWFNFWKEIIIYILSDDFTWKGLGERLVKGLADGIYQAAPWLWNAIDWIATSVVNLFNSIFNINSPSKVMFDAGINITEGLAQGITSGAKEVLGVTSALATSVSDILSGAEVTGSAITSGVSTTNTGEYLSNTGEVMRSKLDVTAGDPCAKGTAASCAAERVAGALGGIGSAITGAMGGIGSSLLDLFGQIGDEIKTIIAGTAEEDLKAASNFYETGQQEIQRKIDEMTSGLKSAEIINNAILGMAKDTGGHIQDARDRIKEVADTARGTTVELTNYATEDLKNKSTEFSTGISEIMRLNNDRAKTATDTFVARVIETNAVAERTLLNNSTIVINSIILLVNTAIAKINSFSSDTNTNTNSVPPVTNSNTNTNSSTHVTNNFNNQQQGSQITFDYENNKFWV